MPRERRPAKPKWRPLSKWELEPFKLPNLNPALDRATLLSETKLRIAWEFNKMYSNLAKKKAVVFTTFMSWDVFFPWAYRSFEPQGRRICREPLVGPGHRKLMKFKVDSDEGTPDYEIWVKMFPELWITKFGAGNIELETMGPTTNVSCIYDVGESSLRVTFRYSSIRAPTFMLTSHFQVLNYSSTYIRGHPQAACTTGFQCCKRYWSVAFDTVIVPP
jgi:hypothetical protein